MAGDPSFGIENCHSSLPETHPEGTVGACPSVKEGEIMLVLKKELVGREFHVVHKCGHGTVAGKLTNM